MLERCIVIFIAQNHRDAEITILYLLNDSKHPIVFLLSTIILGGVSVSDFQFLNPSS